ncbi:hypothetical protein ES703_82607 [subsurface metagenome]
MVSYQDWPEFTNIIGGKYKKPRFNGDTADLSTFRHDIELGVEIIDSTHPVTRGMNNFTIHDEGYMNIDMIKSVLPVLKTTNPFCTENIAWHHQYLNSRVVYILLGHDAQAFRNQHYRKLIGNAIHWVSRGD